MRHGVTGVMGLLLAALAWPPLLARLTGGQLAVLLIGETIATVELSECPVPTTTGC
jgi:hypothetical protein